jgi:hypothetical protein
MMNTVSTAAPVVSGATRTALGSASGMQVYAGPRDDPFFIDLEQFFRIIPDRKPVTGPLSQLPDTPSASSWRNPGIDFLAGFNVLSIIIELPVSQLTGSSGPNFGVWATMSR